MEFLTSTGGSGALAEGTRCLARHTVCQALFEGIGAAETSIVGKTVVEDVHALVVALIGVLGLPVVPSIPTEHVMRKLDHRAVCVF